MRIKKGDKVKIISGKDQGKVAVVLRAIPKEDKLVVENVNLVKKHRKAKGRSEKSERVSLPMPIHVSNAQVVCTKCGKPTRVASKMIGDGRVRICKKCGAEI